MRALIHLVTGACLAVAIGGLLEGVLTRPLISVGLWACALPVFLVAGGLAGAGARILRAQVQRRPAQAWTALCLLSVGLAGVSLWTRWGVRLATRMVQQYGLVEPIMGLWSVIGAAALLAGGGWLAPRLARWRWIRPAALVAAVGCLVVLADPLATLTKDIPLPPILSLCAGIAATPLLARLLARRAARTGRAALGLAAALCAVSLGTAAWGLSRYATDGQARQAVLQRVTLARAIGRRLRRVGDGDGDRYSRWFGGGDCDDADPTRHPFAFDVPGDGIDQDCDGADLVVQPRPTPPLEVQHPLPPVAQKRWNLLFVTVDTVRADRLGLYGHDRATSPRLDALGRAGLVFERAYAPSNATRHTFPALFAGQALGDMPVDLLHRDVVIRPETPLLFERLQAAGWRTEAVVPQQMRDDMWFGLGRGFALYSGLAAATIDERSAPALLADLGPRLERLAAGEAPWALWAHFTEPHEPYLAHDAHPFGSDAIDRYDAEIAAADAALGALLDRLEALGQRERTLVVFTADHGEEFGEHGRRHHGKQVFEESVRVPWVIHVPGAPAVRITPPVSLIDVPATVANLMGVPPARTDGISHVGALSGQQPAPDRPVFIEGGNLAYRTLLAPFAMVKWPYKAVIDPYLGIEALYDLEQDPAETDNLRATEPERWAAMAEALRARRRRHLGQRIAHLQAHALVEAAPADAQIEPQAIAPGLTLVGHQLDTVAYPGRRINRLRLWVRVDEGPRPDIAVQVDLLDASGQWFRQLRSAPFLDLWPSSAWPAGRVVEIKRQVRYARRHARPVRARLTISGGGEARLGPLDLGALR